MDYLASLQATWQYFPYLFCTFVFLTLLPKSLRNINHFAAANYEANRNKYHRCYGPEACCHTQHLAGQAKPKQRKAVTRVYPKRQSGAGAEHEPSFKRPVTTNMLTANHVNKIAKMFESGTTVQHHRKINRVPPTILPEMGNGGLHMWYDDHATSAATVCRGSTGKKCSTQHDMEMENIENAANLLNQAAPVALEAKWRSEPIVIPRQQQQQQQRQRAAVPATLSFSERAFETPSSNSPTASAASSVHSMDLSPTLRRMPLNLKSSLEDIFAAIARNAETGVGSECNDLKFAGCNSLSPVTSIDDILSQRRLSRPLSAYSISDLLNEEGNQQGVEEAFVESVLKSLNKT